MRDSDWTWVLLLALPLMLLGKEDPTTRRRRRSNAIGVATLALFVIAIICYVTGKGIQTAAHKKKARESVNALAYDFTQGKSESVMKWARGEVVDPWGHQVVLVESSSDGVQIASKGPDGELGTEDDVQSDVYCPPKKIVPPEKKKGMVSRLKSFFTGD